MVDVQHVLEELQKNIKKEEEKDADEAIMSSNDESSNVKGFSWGFFTLLNFEFFLVLIL